jgi:hypothetical protein
MMPGTHVSVVNSYEATAEKVPVSLLRSVDLPTEGKPTSPTRASPTLLTSKPSPFWPPPPPPAGPSISSRRSLASLALRPPRWPAVACGWVEVEAAGEARGGAAGGGGWAAAAASERGARRRTRLVLLRAGHLVLDVRDLLEDGHSGWSRARRR